jgi:hypothetical protein
VAPERAHEEHLRSPPPNAAHRRELSDDVGVIELARFFKAEAPIVDVER